VISPFLRLYRTHVRAPLDVRAMRAAAAVLVGRHDFAAFTANPIGKLKSTRRHVMVLTVSRKGKEIVIRAPKRRVSLQDGTQSGRFSDPGGEGAVPPEEARQFCNRRYARRAFRRPKPQGLFLWRVWYPGICA